MIIYPAIELLGGHCVSLRKGRLEDAQVWHVDPVRKAMEFVEAGAPWLMLTDIDAVTGGSGHGKIVAEIIRKAGVPVMLGGGFRTRDGVAEWIDRGAARIVLGTLPTRDPEQVSELAYHYPDQIVLAVDVWRGRVMANGWRDATAYTPEGFIDAFAGLPLAALLVTDIESDIESDASEDDAALGLITGLAGHARTPVIASGIVRSLDDIARLKYVRNVAGAVVGRALFRKSFDLKAALELAEAPLEPIAEFI